MSDTGEKFLARWSRLKEREARPDSPPAAAQPGTPAADPDAQPPALPSINELTIDSDFRAFLHSKVDENVRRAALKKLFSDPHFNVMDGLDTYIDDYSKSDPLPPGMLAQLKHAQQIFAWARETREEGDARIDAPSAPVAGQSESGLLPALAEQQTPQVEIVVQPEVEPASEKQSIASPATPIRKS